MIRYQTRFRVRYAETDQMGIVHHSNYIVWFEMGRIGLMGQLGYPYSQIEASGFLLPVVEVQAAYKKPALFDQELTLVAEVRQKPSARLRFEYQIMGPDESLICTGYSVHGFMNRQNKPVRPPKEFLAKLKEAF